MPAFFRISSGAYKKFSRAFTNDGWHLEGDYRRLAAGERRVEAVLRSWRERRLQLIGHLQLRLDVGLNRSHCHHERRSRRSRRWQLGAGGGGGGAASSSPTGSSGSGGSGSTNGSSGSSGHF